MLVASGNEAIAAVQQQDAGDPYDIVFMDWRMPGMDGLQASRHIKSGRDAEASAAPSCSSPPSAVKKSAKKPSGSIWTVFSSSPSPNP